MEKKEMIQLEDSPMGQKVEAILIRLEKYCKNARDKIEKISKGKYNVQVILKFLD